MTDDAKAHVAAADDAMRCGDVVLALARLVDAWRLVPDRALAEAIESIGPRAARGRSGPAGEAWLAAAAIDDAALRGALVATLRESAIGPRVRALAVHRDPRIATAIVAELLDGNGAGDRHVEARWIPLVGALVGCGDPRVAAHVDAIVETWHGGRKGRAARKERAARLRAGIAAAFPPGPLAQLDARSRARVEAIAAVATRADDTDRADAVAEAALLAAIYADPAADAPRAVYADWLLERGDPRGELIALQLHDRDRERVAALIAAHTPRLLGSLARYATHPEFERGFVARCRIRVDPPPDPAWATVHTITGAVPATDAAPMPLLHTALGLDHAALAHLAGLASPPPIERLGVAGGMLPGGLLGSAGTAAIAAFSRLRLPTLRRLDISGGVEWDDVGPDEMPWPWQRFPLVELHVPGGLRHIAAWVARIAKPLATVVLASGAWRVVLTRDAIDAGNGLAMGVDRDIDAIAYAIARLPPRRRISLQPDSATWSARNRRAIAAALTRHPDAAIDIPGYTPR